MNSIAYQNRFCQFGIYLDTVSTRRSNSLGYAGHPRPNLVFAQETEFEPRNRFQCVLVQVVMGYCASISDLP